LDITDELVLLDEIDELAWLMETELDLLDAITELVLLDETIDEIELALLDEFSEPALDSIEEETAVLVLVLVTEELATDDGGIRLERLLAPVETGLVLVPKLPPPQAVNRMETATTPNRFARSNPGSPVFVLSLR
jgi:hypothetical protein